MHISLFDLLRSTGDDIYEAVSDANCTDYKLSKSTSPSSEVLLHGIHGFFVKIV